MTKQNPKATKSMIINQLKKINKEINSKDYQERVKGIKQLGQMDLQAKKLPNTLYSKLERGLFDSEAEVRKETVMTIAFLEGEIANATIEHLLNDPIQSVRSTTLAALSYIGLTPTDNILDKMMSFLNDPEPSIRDRCVRALGRLKVSQAKSELLELAKKDSSPLVRTGAVVGLGMLEEKDPQLALSIKELKKSETSKSVISAINETLNIMRVSDGK